MDAKKIGKSIAFLRKYHGMTQNDLARKIKVSDKTVSKWETGHGIPDVSILSKIAIILDVDIESLLEGNMAQHDVDWIGVLFMAYPHGIYPNTQMFGMRIVEFQISFFLLAGIKEIYICGQWNNITMAKNSIGNEEDLGIDIHYIECLEMDELKKVIPVRQGMMYMTGCSFIYGKDITKCFRRIMYDIKKPVELVNFQKITNGICFFPLRTWRDDNGCEQYILERGIISFPINTNEDLLDASMLIYIIEKHQKEKIACLEEIAFRRGLIKGKDEGSL